MNYKLLPDAEIDGQSAWVLEGMWKDGATTNRQAAAQIATFGKTRITVNKVDGFVRKVEQFNKDNSALVTATEFHNVKINPDLPDSAFQLTIPPDATVMDMTEMAGQSAEIPGLGGLGGGGADASAPPSGK